MAWDNYECLPFLFIEEGGELFLYYIERGSAPDDSCRSIIFNDNLL